MQRERKDRAPFRAQPVALEHRPKGAAVRGVALHEHGHPVALDAAVEEGAERRQQFLVVEHGRAIAEVRLDHGRQRLGVAGIGCRAADHPVPHSWVRQIGPHGLHCTTERRDRPREHGADHSHRWCRRLVGCPVGERPHRALECILVHTAGCSFKDQEQHEELGTAPGDLAEQDDAGKALVQTIADARIGVRVPGRVPVGHVEPVEHVSGRRDRPLKGVVHRIELPPRVRVDRIGNGGDEEVHARGGPVARDGLFDRLEALDATPGQACARRAWLECLAQEPGGVGAGRHAKVFGDEGDRVTVCLRNLPELFESGCHDVGVAVTRRGRGAGRRGRRGQLSCRGAGRCGGNGRCRPGQVHRGAGEDDREQQRQNAPLSRHGLPTVLYSAERAHRAARPHRLSRLTLGFPCKD